MENQIKDWELEYLAGLIDGEGSICVINRNGYYNICVNITSTDKDYLKMINEKFGGNFISVSRNIRWKDTHTITWHGNKAKKLLETIIDKLFLKKEQAELCLTFPLGPPGSHIPVSEKDLTLREEIHTKIKSLNKRGSSMEYYADGERITSGQLYL